MRYSFSGHETFACKQYWLKKGISYLKNRKSFNDDYSVVDLGVGKNMVNSIRYWLKVFNLTDDQDEPTEFAEFFFGENGVDIYLEDTLTMWLLHYQIIKHRKASIYNLVFDTFRRERHDFTKQHLLNFLERKIEENKESFSKNTLESDIRAFVNNYVSNNPNDIEEGHTNVLQELNLLSIYTNVNGDGQKVDWYKFNVSSKFDLPVEAILFIILDNSNYGLSVSLSQLAIDPAAPGSVFLLTEIALTDKLKEIPAEYGLFTETAGNPVLQVKEGLSKWALLKKYYDAN